MYYSSLYFSNLQVNHIRLFQILRFDGARRAKLELHKEKIIAGKLKKRKQETTNREAKVDVEEIWKMVCEDSLSRTASLEWSSRIESPSRSWRTSLGLLQLPEMAFEYPRTYAERLIYAAYSALMKAGFWITSGLKYGGDFLLYVGKN